MKVLWLDDEIHLLKPHIMFLEREGIDVVGIDHPLKAFEILKSETFDVILVDYKMPQVSGLDFAREIKKIYPNIPIVLVTMVQDSDIMDEAYSIDVFDYLVKPVQPSQIFAVLRKLEKDKIKDRTEVRRVFEYYNRINSLSKDWRGWLEKGRLLFQWMVESKDDELLREELDSLNYEFASWIIDEMPDLIGNPEVPWIFRFLERFVFPEVKKGNKVTLLVFDNFRFDQALEFAKNIPPKYTVEIEPMYSVIPTATQFARNSLFSGLTPYDTERRNPGWLRDNLHEKELMEQNLIEHGLKNLPFTMKKINNLEALKQESFHHENLLQVYVVNFFDMVFHLREEESPLKGLIESAEDYVSLCKFVLDSSKIVEKFSSDCVFITTDHGWVKGEKAVVIQGGQETTEGLRFKFGDSLRAIEGKPLEILNMKAYGIPQLARQLFLAKNYDYFVYRSDPQKYRKKYNGGLFHGGISIEEMIIPLVKMKRR
ncbi:MAG: response regulator [Candidatus Hydrothermia bacterium]